MKLYIRYFCFSLALFSIIITATVSEAAPTEKEVLDAMKKSSGFMVDNVAYRGGYVWIVSEDFSERWGEAPADSTQIWVQRATPMAGMMFLEAYEATGDRYYLECAEKAANALIYGQHPLGGWHYVIDFNMPGIREWYKAVFSQYMWGMEEYRHYYGNCTYDDNTTQSATLFLLRLYMVELNPAYREPLLKALNFMLISQYPSGGWPQRYPPRYDYVHDGFADYTSYYTLNDNAMIDIMDVLVVAYEKLGNEEYLKAARRGADFLIAVQGPEGQAGWADQYGMDMKPAWARTHEPAGLMPRYTMAVIRTLEKFYLLTGDRRYLKPIPGAIKWLEDSAFKVLDNGRYGLANRYEVGTNNPIYQNPADRLYDDGYGVRETTYYPDGADNIPQKIGPQVDIERLKLEFERLSALTPDQAVAEYKAQKTRKPVTPKIDPEMVTKLIDSFDERGAWVENIGVWDWNLVRVIDRVSKPSRLKTIRGISTNTFVRNMNTFINYLGQIR